MLKLVTDSNLNFVQDKSEWANTKIVFDIDEINKKTQLRFTHIGLATQTKCYEACSNAWSQLIHQSLFRLGTTVKGKKVF